MEHVLAGLVHDSATVRLASIRCLHSLSRSVQQLRTTFQVIIISKLYQKYLKGFNFKVH